MLHITAKDAGIGRTLQEMLGRAKDLRLVAPRFRSALRETVRANFAAGGRPTKWAPSKKETLGDLLKGSGRMMNAALNPFMAVSPCRVLFSANVGKVGVIHQVGFQGMVRRGGKPHRMNIPARPYFIIPEIGSEIETYLLIVKDHILSW